MSTTMSAAGLAMVKIGYRFTSMVLDGVFIWSSYVALEIYV
jgi:hypothetical protein